MTADVVTIDRDLRMVVGLALVAAAVGLSDGVGLDRAHPARYR